MCRYTSPSYCQFKPTAQANDTVGDSVIESTFTDEERSHEELGTK